MGTILPGQLLHSEQFSHIIPTDIAAPKDSEVSLTMPEGVNHKVIVMPCKHNLDGLRLTLSTI